MPLKRGCFFSKILETDTPQLVLEGWIWCVCYDSTVWYTLCHCYNNKCYRQKLDRIKTALDCICVISGRTQQTIHVRKVFLSISIPAAYVIPWWLNVLIYVATVQILEYNVVYKCYAAMVWVNDALSIKDKANQKCFSNRYHRCIFFKQIWQ